MCDINDSRIMIVFMIVIVIVIMIVDYDINDRK